MTILFFKTLNNYKIYKFNSKIIPPIFPIFLCNYKFGYFSKFQKIKQYFNAFKGKVINLKI